MSFLNFSENQFALIWNLSESLNISSLEITNKIELEHIRAKIFKKGSPSGKIKLQIFTTRGNLICESSEVNFSDILSNFIGFIRFDFQRNNLQIGNYIVKASISDYTRDGESNFFSMLYDFPVKIYPNSKKHFDEHSIAIEIFGRY